MTRTRTALIEAFNHLVLSRRHKRIRVSDIVAEANVGRSTFYEHYRSAEDIHMEALSKPFALLADAASGKGDPDRLTNLLSHFWENRQRARETIAGRNGERAGRMLAELVEQRLGETVLIIPTRLAALQLAEAAFAPVRGWLLAEAPCTPAALAASICRCGQQMLAALAED